jgi:hypothetical protein
MTNLIVDRKRFSNQLTKLVSSFEKEVSNGLTEIAAQAANVARENVSGRSADGLWANTRPYKISALEQGVLSNKYYASWVEFGNGPPGSRIYPVSAKALHFFVDGKEIFAKSVAASKPHPYMSKAVDFINTNGTTIMMKHINNAIGL